MTTRPHWVNAENHIILWRSEDNTIYQTSEGYWFVDECWMDSCGPYPTYKEVTVAFGKYCGYLNSGEPY